MNQIETRDLYCGAYILSSGGMLEETRIEGIRGGKPSVTFIFSGEAVRQFLIEYNSGQAFVNAAGFKAAMMHLKDVMFERIREREQKKERENYGSQRAL